MKILFVGNDPHEIGGVANYTRPLANKLVELGHNVYYLYSGAYQKKYNWFLLPYLKINKNEFSFECAEIINSPNVPFNYSMPELDWQSPKIEKIFLNYLKRIKPDVVHIHSRYGLPFSIAKIAAIKGMPVFNTIHVYGLLCQKRVMIDSEGMPCNGPENIEKCTICTESEDFNARKFKFTSRIFNTSANLTKVLVDIKNILKKNKSMKTSYIREAPLSCKKPNSLKINKLTERLRFNIETMNKYVDINICVSNDVKKTLMQYGVQENKLLVKHIGSVVAENQEYYHGKLHTPLTIGNIGGVNYYKGTHVLIDAIEKVKNKNYTLKIYGKYEQSFMDNIMKKRKNLPICFLGKYLPDDLPSILKEIDIMILPSICNDTAPQTIFESYSMGIPIIASKIGGFPDFITEDLNGLLFEPNNSDDLACKIDYILEHPNLIIRLAKNVPKLKTITEDANDLAYIYRKYLEGK